MRLTKLMKNIECDLIGADCEIERIEYDSRKVRQGDMFCCINGTFKDGHEFAQAAVDAGASALMVERRLPIDITQVLVPNSRIAMAEAAAEFYGHPTAGIPVVGITGTNGKTTTTYMIKTIAEKAGLKVGLIGTIRNLVGNKVIPTERTTPESVELQRVFRIMRDEGVELIVMEVSSHSLDQNRVHGIEYAVGGFTNLTQDHLDYHKTFENYLAAKKRMFARSKFAVVNADDYHSALMLEGLNLPSIGYGIRNESAAIRATNIEICAKNVEFDLSCPEGTRHITVNIPGLFNVFNAMLAAGVMLKLGFGLDVIAEGLSDISGVSGRMEALNTGGFDFTVILDFAHTPDGLVNLLTSVQEFAKGRVITVFGCGGDRDKLKRPLMGEMSARYSDFCVVTSDNPRTEDPMRIIDMVLEGVRRTACEHEVIENRREAIRYALSIAEKDDVVVLAGKGHENYQEINGVKYPFDEKDIVSELLDEMRKGI
ncbi:MAG: UDP-N-acetylmuramoyl-L-alanyl-D-glutamate--2,6-diaminopimelate ligase [Christensenellaceae bacterium]|nr:UDP-N-acetylmuramoyl-L-alanyl-D-glutamate--2,6-diaminopimelate ligase [Christensenellaceae bacterium]